MNVHVYAAINTVSRSLRHARNETHNHALSDVDRQTTLWPLQNVEPDHYAILGLDRKCTGEQVRAAYRILAKRFHPDVNNGSAESIARTQELNAAYEILNDPSEREAYDQAREIRRNTPKPSGRSAGTIERNIAKEVHLRIEDFLRGTSLDIKVNDSGNPDGQELYTLVIPPETAPGTRFRVPRTGAYKGGFVIVRTKAMPGFRFKVRGSDLRCDLKIPTKLATQGGSQTLPGATGSTIRVQIPAGIARGDVVTVPGEGLPKPRGGRGDLIVRIQYQPEVRITRSSRH
ncbi:MAG: DnaJ family protein [Verrucomicrobia bacterium]|jgi:molecular chaperone DnaJ|nr:DnaJ family protein [Verrucomicrobiota bacterium]